MKMINRKDYILKMTIAFEQHHGYTPGENHLREWGWLFDEL